MHLGHVSAGGPEAVVDALETYFPGIAVGASDGRPFRFDFDGWTDAGGVTLLDYGLTSSEIVADVAETGFAVGAVDGMDGEMSVGRDEIDLALPYAVLPGLHSRYRSARARLLVFDDTVVDRALQHRSGHATGGRFRFTGTHPVSPDRIAHWKGVADLLDAGMRSELADGSIVIPPFAELAVNVLIETFPSTWVEDESALTTPPTAAVRRAVAYIDEHPDGPVALTSLAGAARLSTRGLQKAFARQLGMSPLAYLRMVRLRRARETLRLADPSDPHALASVARRAGFGSVAGFVTAYTAQFGEPPVPTLGDDSVPG